MFRLLSITLLLLPMAAFASPPALVPSPSQLCETAIFGAERSVRLPSRLLSAIAEVESGRPDGKTGAIRPWPWTINAEGRGQFFATKAQAVAAVHVLQVQGVRSIDVGCMQVNLMHHPNAFASLEEAFDPVANAQYAGRFLNSLYGVSGSWVQATAAYHSETPAIGAEYQRRVLARLQQPLLAGTGAYATTQSAYQAFAPTSNVYADFKPADRVYGAFAEPAPTLARLATR